MSTERFLAAAIAIGVVVAVLSIRLATRQDERADRTCRRLYAMARTASDSLAIARERSRCLDLLPAEAP